MSATISSKSSIKSRSTPSTSASSSSATVNSKIPRKSKKLVDNASKSEVFYTLGQREPWPALIVPNDSVTEDFAVNPLNKATTSSENSSEYQDAMTSVQEVSSPGPPPSQPDRKGKKHVLPGQSANTLRDVLDSSSQSTSIKTLEDKLNKTNEEVQSLQEKLAQTEKHVMMLENEIKDAKEKLQEAKDLHNTEEEQRLRKQVEGLEKNIKDIRKENEELRQQLSDALRRERQLSDELRQRDNELRQRNNKYIEQINENMQIQNETSKENAQLQREIGNQVHESKEKDRLLREQVQVNQELQSEIDELRRRNQELITPKTPDVPLNNAEGPPPGTQGDSLELETTPTGVQQRPSLEEDQIQHPESSEREPAIRQIFSRNIGVSNASIVRAGVGQVQHWSPQPQNQAATPVSSSFPDTNTNKWNRKGEQYAILKSRGVLHVVVSRGRSHNRSSHGMFSRRAI